VAAIGLPVLCSTSPSRQIAATAYDWESEFVDHLTLPVTEGRIIRCYWSGELAGTGEVGGGAC
jgi:hypothetical protein